MSVNLRSTTTRAAAATAWVLVVAAACGGDDIADTVPDTTSTSTTSTSTTSTSTTSTSTTTTEVTMPDEQPAVVGTAIADLVGRIGVDHDAVTVARFESVTWRDGAIGCPEPGTSYTQALVPGYRIELVVDDTSHWYHGARDGEPFWCADPSDPAEDGSGDT